MVRKYHLVGVAAALLFAGAGLARAGMTGMTSVGFTGDTTINCQYENWLYSNTYHTLEWSITNGTGDVSLADNEVSTGSDTHTYNMTLDGDPTVNLSTLVMNNSGVDWTAYDVTVASLTPGVTVTFTGTPTSSPVWQDTVVVTPSSIHYSGVSTSTPLANGGSDTLVYTLNIVPPIGYSGSISYSITSTPTLGSGSGVPEPASLSVLALGAAGLVLRRRGR